MRYVICLRTIVILCICVQANQIETNKKLSKRSVQLLDEVDDFENIIEPEPYQKYIYGRLGGKKDDRLSQALRKVDVIDLSGIDDDINNVKRNASISNIDEGRNVKRRRVRSNLKKYENLLSLKYGGFRRNRRKRDYINKRNSYANFNILPSQLFDKRNSYIGYLAEATNDKLLKMQDYAATMMVILTTEAPQLKQNDSAAASQNVTIVAGAEDLVNNTGKEQPMLSAEVRPQRDGIYEPIRSERADMRDLRGQYFNAKNLTWVGFDRSNPLQNIPVFTADSPIMNRQAAHLSRQTPLGNIKDMSGSDSSNSQIASRAFFQLDNSALKTSDNNFPKNKPEEQSGLDDKTKPENYLLLNKVNETIGLEKNIPGDISNPLAVEPSTFQNLTGDVMPLQFNNENVQIQNNTMSKNNMEKPLRYVNINPETDVSNIANKIKYEEKSLSSEGNNQRAVVNSTLPLLTLDGSANVNAAPNLGSFNVTVKTGNKDVDDIYTGVPGAKFSSNYITNAFAINTSSDLIIKNDAKSQLIDINKQNPATSPTVFEKYRSTPLIFGNDMESRVMHERNMAADSQKDSKLATNFSHLARYSDEDQDMEYNRNSYASDALDDNEDKAELLKVGNMPMRDDVSSDDSEFNMSNNYKMHQLTANEKNKRDSDNQDFRRGGTQEQHGKIKKSISGANMAGGNTILTAHIIDPRLLMNNSEILNAIYSAPRSVVANAEPVNFDGASGMARAANEIALSNVPEAPEQFPLVAMRFVNNGNYTSSASTSSLTTTPASTTTTYPTTTKPSRRTTSVSDNPYYWENVMLHEAHVRVRKEDTPSINSSGVTEKNDFGTSPNVQEKHNTESQGVQEKNAMYSETCEKILQSDVLHSADNVTETITEDPDDEFNMPKDCINNSDGCNTDIPLDKEITDQLCATTEIPSRKFTNTSITSATNGGDNMLEQANKSSNSNETVGFDDSNTSNKMPSNSNSGNMSSNIKTDENNDAIISKNKANNAVFANDASGTLQGNFNSSKIITNTKESNYEALEENSGDDSTKSNNVSNNYSSGSTVSAESVNRKNDTGDIGASIQNKNPTTEEVVLTTVCIPSKFLVCPNVTEEEKCGDDVDDEFDDNECEEGVPGVLPKENCPTEKDPHKPKSDLKEDERIERQEKNSVGVSGSRRFRRHASNKLATPIGIESDGTCSGNNYNATKNCSCSIDIFLKNLKHKSTEKEFKETIDKYLCNSFIPLHKGVVLGKGQSVPQKRSKREDNEVHKRDVIQNAEISRALENDFLIKSTDKLIYATPGGDVRILCAPPPLESTTGTWRFNGKSLTEGKIIEGNGYITVDTIVAQDGGNYTCTDVHGLAHVHKLSVITLPFFIVNASTLYEVSDNCEEKYADLIQKYLSSELSDIMCGSEHKMCNLVVHNTHCVHKGTKDYLETSFELGMEPLEMIMPNLNKTDCDITCQLKLYSQMAGILVKNMDIFQTQPVYFNISSLQQMVLRPTEPESNADNEGTSASKLVISCAPGFGLIPGSHICEACGPNKFSGGDEAFCSDCPLSTYQPSSGSKSCLVCNSILDDILCVKGIIMDGNRFVILTVLFVALLVFLFIGLGCAITKKGGSKDPTDCSQYRRRRKRKKNDVDVEKQEEQGWSKNSRRRSTKETISPPQAEFMH